MYRSYSYNNMPQPVIRREEPQKPPPPPPQKREPAAPAQECRNVPERRSDGIGGFLKNLQTDDIILIVVILALMIDDCDDKLLLLALAFVFFSDLF